ncbi:Copper chaperone domain-containing protein [Dioscorea alata]|uniref:Copper chaperone domain-containing protein n=1 Tax=Dioscorea alata TaxID=55571 RepID=A0ACB7UUQ0_DIOAL|nr:Copper chaperone domain-containing protein [Dioscorea alata]
MGEAKPEEKKEETKDQEKKEEKTEEKNVEAKTAPPNQVILFVDLHCVGCAKKIERTILKYRGVEEVEINMVQNQVTVKGILDPQTLCSRIQKKTRRKAKIISPVPPVDQGDTNKPDIVVESQVNGTVPTVELLVNMHCDACAQTLQKKILEMRGVQRVEAELKSGKVTVTGTIETEKLLDYIHRRTGKIAKPITPPKEEVKKEDDKPPEEKKEEKHDEEGMKKEDDTEEKKDEKEPTVAQEQESGVDGDEKKKEGDAEGGNNNTTAVSEEDMVKKTMNWSPFYMIERLPPPQIFSDENPNACCIS